MEEWREIKGFPDYEISNHTKVRKKVDHKPVNITGPRYDPVYVYLRKPGPKKQYAQLSIPSLMMKHFETWEIFDEYERMAQSRGVPPIRD